MRVHCDANNSDGCRFLVFLNFCPTPSPLSKSVSHLPLSVSVSPSPFHGFSVPVSFFPAPSSHLSLPLAHSLTVDNSVAYTRQIFAFFLRSSMSETNRGNEVGNERGESQLRTRVGGARTPNERGVLTNVENAYIALPCGALRCVFFCVRLSCCVAHAEITG